MPPPNPDVSDGLPAPRRYFAAAAVALGMMMSVLDGNIITVALPELSKELNISPSHSIWISNSYNLSVLAFLLPCAALGERLGLQKIFRMGIIIFILGSLGFLFSNSLIELCLFKAFQGIGGAAMMGMMGGLTRFNYPTRLFAKGIGINAMVVSVSSMAGPIVGSTILHLANWHYLSLLNIPIGIIALIFSIFLAKTPCQAKKFDYISAILAAITLCLLVYSIDSLVSHPLLACIGGIISFACGYVLVQRAKNQDTPLVPIDLLKINAFRFAVYVSSFTFAASMAVLISLPFHLKSVFNLTQLEVGYYFIIWPLGSGSMALFAAKFIDKYSAAVLAGIGASVMAFAIFGLAIMPASTPHAILLLFIGLVGVGFGFFQTPNNKVMLSSAPKERSGAAGGAQATTRVFSQSIGAAIAALSLALPVAEPTRVTLWGAFLCALIATVINILRYKALD